MKFINIITVHTEENLQAIVSQLDSESIKRQQALYRQFDHVEYNLDGFVAMYAIVTDKILKELIDIFTDCEITFTLNDMTQEVLFGFNPKTNDIDKQADLMFMTRRFVRENITLDIVLDKIQEKGKESLSFTDKKLLESI